MDWLWRREPEVLIDNERLFGITGNGAVESTATDVEDVVIVRRSWSPALSSAITNLWGSAHL
jgi:hypothetical protein